MLNILFTAVEMRYSLQIKLSEALNPIMQDVKKGKVRFVNNCFPYHGYIWNYGAFPQVRLCQIYAFSDDSSSLTDVGKPQPHGPQYRG